MLEKAIRRDFVGRENLQSINYTGKQYWKYNVSIDCGTEDRSQQQCAGQLIDRDTFSLKAAASRPHIHSINNNNT